MVISLGWLSPATSRGLPAAPATRAGSRCLLGLAPTGRYRAASVAGRAVGSYPTVSPLPLDKGRSVFCGPIRRLAAPRRYLAVCPTELGLSSMRQSSRRTATITPYRHPVSKLPAPEGWGQASAHEPAEQASHAVTRQSRGVGTPRPPRAGRPPAPTRFQRAPKAGAPSEDEPPQPLPVTPAHRRRHRRRSEEHTAALQTHTDPQPPRPP